MQPVQLKLPTPCRCRDLKILYIGLQLRTVILNRTETNEKAIKR